MTADQPMTFLFFALVCVALLILPFMPALREWLKPTDVAALRVLPDYSNDIDHFARRLHADVQARLGTGAPTGFEDFTMVNPSAAPIDWAGASSRLMMNGNVDADAAITCSQPIFVSGSLRAGAGCELTSVYATGDIELGANSMLKDWAHADGTVRMHGNCAALRRISAGKAIELGHETWFERLQAPAVHFGAHLRAHVVLERVQRVAGNLADLPGVVVQAPNVFMVRGDCSLPAGQWFEGSLIVTGFLVMGNSSVLIGDIKARDGVSIGTGCDVQGAITCDKRIYVFARAHVMGPVVSESDILIGTGAHIGSADAHTTVTAANIIVEDGVLVHGAVWAHEIGMVKSA